jgi:hypothetical protein
VDSLPVFYLVLFGLLLLLSHVAGAVMANWSFRDAARFQGSLLADWDRLKQENKLLHEEVFQLRGEILELKQRLNAAEDHIAQYSSQLTTEREASFTG